VSNLVPIRGVLKDPKKMYELPFIFSMVGLVFIIPIAFAVLDEPQIAPDLGYNIFMINASMCFWAAIIGYNKFRPRINIYKSVNYDHKKMLYGLIPLFIISQAASWYLSTIEVEGLWSGLPVYVLFFARFYRPAAIVLMINYLLRPTKLGLILLVIWLIGPLNLIFIAGRRSEVAILALTILVPLFFIKKWTPPKAAIFPAIFVAFFVVTMFPIIRQYTLQGNFDQVSKLNYSELLDDYFQNESTNEFVESTLNLGAVYRSESYSYGTGFYNYFIKQYIPGGILGRDFKNNLMMDPGFNIETIRNNYGDYGDFKFYLAPIGYAQAFYEFGFLSFIVFYFFGRICKKLFINAMYTEDLYYVAIYSAFSILIFYSVYSSLVEIPTFFLFYYILIKIVFKYSRKGVSYNRAQ
jgi:hypothetical protein